MVPLQIQDGRAVHTVLVKALGTGDAFVAFHTFDEYATDLHLFSYFAEEAIEGVQYVRIEFSVSPSWVVWREVEVIGPR